jgi:TonB-linked SusC/RagA family outer membrane protein
MQFSFAQERTVKGIVTDANGSMPGVNVMVKGTQRGVSTGFDGAYSIKASVGEVLVFSFMGMNDVSRTVDASSVFNVKMQDDTTVLEAVVVTAVGIKKRPDAITSSNQVIGTKEITAASNPDVVRSLIGKVSGLTISATGNGVNGTNSIRIRSMLSLTGNTEALVVIDGVISTSDVFAALPSGVVQNVTVLKGAQGAALYGSQGKQGVILVQTKKGTKDEKLTVAFTSSSDLEQINFVPERQQSYGQGWFGAYDEQENGGWGIPFDGVVRNVGLPLEDGTYVTAPYSSLGNNEIKKFYQTGNIFQNNLNVSAGNADGYVNLNLSNLRRNFILEGDNFNRNSFALSAGKKINKFRIGGSVTFINQRTKQADINATSSGSRTDYTLLSNLLQTASNIPISEFENRGEYGWNGYYQNPYFVRKNNRINDTNNFVNIGLNGGYELNKHIELVYNGSVQMRNINQYSYANAAKGVAFAFGGLSSPSNFFQTASTSTFYYGDLMANFNYSLTEKVGMKFNIGQNMQYNYRKRVSQGGLNLDIPGFYNINNVLNPALPSSLDNRTIVSTTTASFANADFNYDDYLFLNVTGRYEGNSVAKKGNQFYFYPSAGVSFIPTKAFAGLKDKSTLSSLKLYGNYSIVGSLDPVLPYDILSLAATSAGFPFPGTGSSFSNLTNITDPNIKPETYTTIEGGINFGFFKDRLTLDATAFLTKTEDLITRRSLSTTTGLATQLSNAGELEGKGFELDLGFTPISNENFKWNGRISYSAYDTKVIDAGESSTVTIFDVSDTGSNINANISAVEGLSFPYITGTDWRRDQNGNVIVNSEGRPTADATYKNLAKVTPDYIVGLTNNFEYKGIGLGFVMDYRTGHSFMSQTKYNLTWNGHLVESAEFDRNVGFIYPGSVIDDPSTATVGDYIPNTSVYTGGFYTTASTLGNRTQSYYGDASSLGSFNIIDATALKVREIVLSYSLSKKSLQNTGLESFKISFNARNPIVVLAKDNKGYADPEASSQFNANSTNSARNAAGTVSNTSRNGIGFIGDSQYPSTRTFGFSINATF